MILLIGGSVADHQALEVALAGSGFSPIHVPDWDRAWSVARKGRPDLALLVGEPDLCRRVRSDPLLATVPVLAAAGPGDGSRRSQALEAGADDVITWPPDPIELRARVASLVQLGRTRHRLNTLQASSAAIASSQDLSFVLAAIARDLCDLLGASACAIYQWNPENQSFRRLARYAHQVFAGNRQPWQEAGVPDAQSMQRILKDRRAQEYALGQPGIDPAVAGYMQGLGTKTLLRLPMVVADRAVGLVEVMDDRASRGFAEDEISLAQLLANRAAAVVENAGLDDAIRRHVAELTTLSKIGQVITSVLDLNETLSIIADHAMRLLDVAAASVILYDEESGDLWFGASSGEGSDFIQGKRLELGPGIVNWVIQNGEPLMVQDVASDPRFFDGWDRESGFTTRSILCVPLRSKGRTIGAIETVNKAGGPYDREDLNLLVSMAASATIAIENARLYERAQREIAERNRAEEEIRHLYRELRAHASGLEEAVDARTRELQTERDRTQAILEAVGEAVIVTDLEGKIRYVNPAAVALTGYAADEVVGQTPEIWQEEEGAANWFSLFRPDSRSVQRQVVSRRKDGTLYDAAMTVAPLFDSQQTHRLVGYVCVQRDITPIKEAERLKDQFVSNVSHELRTPLSVITLIVGNLDRLYDRLSDDKRRKMIQDVRDQAQVLNHLVGDVLEISRIESGHISMERRRVDLVQLARAEVEQQLPLARKKSLALRMIGDEAVAVWGHADQLQQVIRNLLNNAIKFTPQKGHVICECRSSVGAAFAEADWPGSAGLPAGRWAALRVVDTGIGISAEELPHLFERFYRAKTQGNIPGTGLGLSIARQLVELHDGQIATASVPGEGSIFAIYIPLLEE